MPIIFHEPRSRRSFLKISTVGLASIITGSSADDVGRSKAKVGEFRLALLSDTHIPADRVNGHRGFNPWKNLQGIVPSVVATKPEAVILNGDAARLVGLPDDYSELAGLLKPIAQTTPIYMGLGNHDDRANFQNAFPKATGLQSAVDGKHILLIEHPVVRILVLDSLDVVNKSPGLLGETQLRWLGEYLPKSADRPLVIFVHHTLGKGGGNLIDAAQLFSTLKPHRQVKAIFYGHSHVWETKQEQGLHLINLPAVGYNFKDIQPVGWVSARFIPEGVDLTLHATGGNVALDGTRSELRWA